MSGKVRGIGGEIIYALLINRINLNVILLIRLQKQVFCFLQNKIDNLLSNYDAKVLESYLISIIGRRDLELGPLTNHSNGWEEDTYNTKLTTGHKQKLKGHIPWNKKEKIEVACDYCNKKLYRLPSHIHKTNFCCSSHLGKYLKKEKIKINCNNCGALLEKGPSELRKNKNKFFCDKQCYLFFIKKQKIVKPIRPIIEKLKYNNICFFCNKEYITLQKQQVKRTFCSEDCRKQHKQTYKKVTVHCSTCKAELKVCQSIKKYKRNFFCNDDCKIKSRKIANVKCSFCAKEFTTSFYKIKTTKKLCCSSACSYALIIKRATVFCTQCNAELILPICRIKNIKKHFCGMPCRNTFYTNKKIKIKK